MITELKNLTLTTTDKSYSFGIENAVAESEDEEDVLTITYEGNPLTTENFQNYYQYLVGIELNEKTFERVSGTPVLTVAATRTDGSQTGLRFIKHSDRRYYVEAAGEPVGFISTTYMDKILNYLADVAADKTVPEPY